MPTLRHKLIIEQNTPTVSASGARTDSWSTFAEVWGDVSPGRSREFMAAKAVQADLTAEVTIRYTAAILAAMRINFGSRYLYLAGPPINGIPGQPWTYERNEWLTLLCREKF